MVDPTTWMFTLTALYAACVVVFLPTGPRLIRRPTARFARQVRLPLEGPSAVEVPRRLLARWRASLAGAAVGLAVGALFSLVAHAPPYAGAWWVSGGIVGACAGAFAVHLHVLRRASRTRTRSALLTVRRFGDYLSPAQRTTPYVALVLPVLAVVVGGLALVSGDPRRAVAAASLVTGVVAILLVGALLLVQRYALNVPAPAGSPLELRWEEALRGLALRDLFVGTLCVECVLGGLNAFTTAVQLTTLRTPLTLVTGMVLLLGVVTLLWATISVSGATGPADRFRRRLDLEEPAPAAGATPTDTATTAATDEGTAVPPAGRDAS